jgi:phage/plasmid-like protein (TIGR03299 family)
MAAAQEKEKQIEEKTSIIEPKAREVSWLRGGRSVSGSTSAEQALSQAGLDWKVDTRPAGYQREDGSWAKVEDRVFTVRDSDGRAFEAVSKGYAPFQNHEQFAFADNLVHGGAAEYVSAGELRGGKWTYLCMNFPDEILVGGQVPHKLYLAITSSHDGSRALNALVTPVCIVCENTYVAAIGQAQYRWTIRHTGKDRDSKIQAAREALELSVKAGDAFQLEAEKLLSESFTEKQMKNLADKLVPEAKHADDKKAAIVNIFRSSPTIEGYRNTKLAAFAAVSEYMEWGRSRTGHAQLMSLTAGNNHRLQQKTFGILAAA